MSPTNHSSSPNGRSPAPFRAGPSQRQIATDAYRKAEETAAGALPQAPPPAPPAPPPPPRGTMTTVECLALIALGTLSASLVILATLKAGELLSDFAFWSGLIAHHPVAP